MVRTQLYLDEDAWNVLHQRAQSEGSTISELVRQAVQEKYLGDRGRRRKAMQAFIAIRKDHPEFSDAASYIRGLRRGRRIERLRGA